MDSFQPSRGRTFFETLCAVALSASLAGAWTQTGASALLGGSVAAALFGLSHAFGVRQPKAAEAVEPQRIDFVTDDFGDVLVHQEVEVPFATADLPPEPTFVVEEPVAPQAKAAKAPRKPRSRKVAEEPAPVEEPVHVQLAPLFEPEPFARTQHAVFGRRHTLR